MLGTIIDAEDRKFSDAYNQLLRMLSRIRLAEIAELNYAFCLQHTELLSGIGSFEIEKQKAYQFKKQHE